MKEIKASELKDNLFEAIGTEWMLVTAGDESDFNMMTASWGGTGILWGQTVAFIFIRPERYTYEFIEAGSSVTLAFLGNDNKAVHSVCGSKSGRTTDKVAETGLEPVITPSGNITYRQARLTLECHKLYADTIDEENFIEKPLVTRWYGGSHGGFHKMYILQIDHVWVK